MEIIDVFECVAVQILRRQKHNEDQTNNVVALRDALLPRLISGELRVKDAERWVGGCA